MVEKSGRVLVVEAKWTELDDQEAERLLSALTIKAQRIPNMKECIPGIMAKKIRDKDRIRSMGLIALDLRDMENLIRHENNSRIR